MLVQQLKNQGTGPAANLARHRNLKPSLGTCNDCGIGLVAAANSRQRNRTLLKVEVANDAIYLRVQQLQAQTGQFRDYYFKRQCMRATTRQCVKVNRAKCSPGPPIAPSLYRRESVGSTACCSNVIAIKPTDVARFSDPGMRFLPSLGTKLLMDRRGGLISRSSFPML